MSDHKRLLAFFVLAPPSAGSENIRESKVGTNQETWGLEFSPDLLLEGITCHRQTAPPHQSSSALQ
jgi:hypothetical protein